MYQKYGIVYADAYNYIRHKTKNIRGLAVPGDMEDFEELPIDMDTLIRGEDYILLNGFIKISIPSFTHKDIKTKIIESRYSNNDQIAIMLNNDEDSMDKMQKWRNFADDISKKIVSGKLYIN